MPKANPIYTNFSAGEWSARMEGRVDLDKYYHSCRILENFIIVSQGGADFRPGTAYITTGKTDALKIRLIPFSIKGVGEYILELGNTYINVIKCSTHAQLETAPGVALKTDVVTPFLTADLFEVKYAQTKDAIYFVHPSYAPVKVVRTDDTTDWTLTYPTFSGWDASTEKDIVNINQANPCMVAAAGHLLINGDVVYITDVVGMTELNSNVYVVTWVDADDVTLNNTDSTTYTAYVSGGHIKKAGNIFSGAGNYPSAIGFYQQRMCLAGTNNHPDWVWMAKTGSILDYKLGATATGEGLLFEVYHDRGLFIKWLAGKGVMVFGADSCEGVIFGKPITSTNYDLRVESGYGSENIQGRLVNDKVLFVQDGGKRVRAFMYSEEAGGWLSPDLTLFADHITGDGIVETEVQRNPDTIFWCVRDDGVLAGLTLTGWFRVLTGDTIAKDSAVESMAIARGTAEDEIYVSVKRTVDGTTKRFIEYFKPRDFGSDQKDCYFVDCGITWDGGDAATITNISQADPPIVTSAAHPFDDGDMVQLADVVESDEGLLDCSTFVEVDPGADIALTANTVTVTELDRDQHSLLYKSLGYEFLDGAFTYTFQINLVAFETAGRSMLPTWGVSDTENTMHTLIDGDGNALSFIARKEGDTDHLHFQIWEIYGGEAQSEPLDVEYALATDYYVTISRTITGGDNDCGELTAEVYSDADRTILLQTKTISLNSVVNYTILYAVQNYEDISGTGLGWDDYTSLTITDLSGPANRSSYNQCVFTVDDDAANTFTLDDEDDVDINGFEYKQYVSGGTATKVTKTVTAAHLVGEEATILADGGTHPVKTVAAGGVITLDRYANVVHAGLGYTGKLRPARPEGGGSYGSAQGKKKRIHKLVLRVYKSLCGKFGPDEDNLQALIPDSTEYDTAPPLVSGDVGANETFPGGWDREGKILIVQDQPLPLNILAIMPEMTTNDG